jgi:hypothetical protein
MLFISFWKLSDDADPVEVAKLGHGLTEKGAFPVKGIKLHAWLITPGGKGIAIVEAENAEALFNEWLAWTRDHPGILSVMRYTRLLRLQGRWNWLLVVSNDIGLYH